MPAIRNLLMGVVVLALSLAPVVSSAQFTPGQILTAAQLNSQFALYAKTGNPLSQFAATTSAQLAGVISDETGTGAVVFGTSPTISTPVIAGGSINNATVGATTPSTGSFTTLAASGTVSGAGFTTLLGPYATLASPTFTGTVTLPKMAQASTGQFFGNLGATVSNLNDRVFIGMASPFSGNQNTNPTDWTGTGYILSSSSQPAYGYLEANSTFVSSAQNNYLAGVFAANANGISNSGAAATIGVSSVVQNAGTGAAGYDTWNFYGTSVRTATATGLSTLGMELEIGNLGSTTVLYPANMFQNGITSDLWLGPGGELAASGSGYTLNNLSSAVAILGGASAGSPSFNKGIIFQNTAIAGSNGATGTSQAITMSPGQQIVYFNNSNQLMGGFYGAATTNTTASLQQFVDVSNVGTVVQDGNGYAQFQFANGVTAAANYITATAAVSGSPPTLVVNGTDTNQNLSLSGKGTGTVVLPQNDVLSYTNTSGQSIANSTATTVTGWTKQFDRINANFNASTGTFTAPTAGYYHVDAGINYAASTSSSITADYQVAVVTTGSGSCVSQESGLVTGAVVHAATVGCDVSLAAGQAITIQAFQTSGAAAALATSAGVNYVSIHKIP